MPGWGLKDIITIAGVIVATGSLAVTTCTYRANREAEESRWRAHLEVQPVLRRMVLPYDLVFTAPDVPGEIELQFTLPEELLRGAKALPPAKAMVRVGASALQSGPGDEKPMRFLLRNGSFRPVAVVSVALGDASGTEWDVGAECVPSLASESLVVDPWRARPLGIPLRPGPDARRPVRVVLFDMDGNSAQIPLDQWVGGKWFAFEPSNIQGQARETERSRPEEPRQGAIHVVPSNAVPADSACFPQDGGVAGGWNTRSSSAIDRAMRTNK